MKKIYLFAILALFALSCTDLRDLHDTTDAVLHVDGSWSRSLGESDMKDATVMLHHSDGSRVKKHLERTNGVSVNVTKGEYDVLVFNGVMESEQDTNLEQVRFRGTDKLETFEVYAVEATPLSRLTRAEDEYIASNKMELFTFAHHRVMVDEDSALYVKYRNGEKTESEDSPYVAGRISSTPRAMSFYFQVRLTGLANPTSARSASGAFRGFLGSVYMPASVEKPRPGFFATHHLTLSPPSANRITRVDGEDLGTLVSPRFVSFGPPLPENLNELSTSGEYFFEPVFVLTDGTEYTPGPIDVTVQVNETIARMLEHHGDGEDISHEENIFEITIDDRVALPVVVGGSGGDGGLEVDVEPWDEEEVVIVWIRP